MACDISERLGGFIKRLVDVSQRFGQMESQEDVVVAAETFLTKLDKLISMLELLPDTSDDPPPPAKRQKKTATITKTATAATITKATATSTPTRPRRQSAGRRKIQKQSEEIEISSGLHEVEDDSDVLVKTEPSSSSFLDEPVGEIANEDYKVVKADIMEEGDDREDHDDGDDGDYGNDGDDGDYGDDGDDANDANDGDDNNDNLEDDAVEDEHPSDVKDTKMHDLIAEDQQMCEFSVGSISLKDEPEDIVPQPTKQVVRTVAKRHTCDSCPYSTTVKSNLNRHRQATHSGKRFACDICTKTYVRQDDLATHTRAVHDNEPGTCHFCGKLFRSKRGLEEHEKVHSAGKPFACQEAGCGKSYHRRRQLDGHINTVHRNYKPYRCSVRWCKRTFAHSDSLQAHMKVCCSRVTFPCKVNDCMYVANTAATLKEHRLAKHSNKVFQCSCGKTFAWRPSLNKHMLKEKHQKA